MIFFRIIFFTLLLSLPLVSPAPADSKGKAREISGPVPILLYHRFGPVVADSMTVTTEVFESNLKFLKERGYVVIQLRQLIDYYLGKAAAPPPHSVVITVDDGHRSVYTDMFPLIKKYKVPVTLFLYPSAISNASYAMTWEQLREIKKSGLFDFQSHTYWHPNFIKEKKRLPPTEYEKFVQMQLTRSKTKLERELGTSVDMLAWPFGIYDDELALMAARAGYKAAFSMDQKHAGSGENIMFLPRYLLAGPNAEKTYRTTLEVHQK